MEDKCKNLDISEIINLLEKYHIRGTVLYKLTKTSHGKASYAELVTKCIKLFKDNSIDVNPSIKYHLNDYIKNLFYAERYSRTLSIELNNIKSTIDSINIINDINKLVEIASFNLLNNNKDISCELINIHETSYSEENIVKRNINVSLTQMTNHVVTNILGNKKEYLLKMLYIDLNHYGTMIDKAYIEPLGSHVITLKDDVIDKNNGDILILIKINSHTIKSIHELDNKDDIKKVSSVLNNQIPFDDELNKFTIGYNAINLSDEIGPQIEVLDNKLIELNKEQSILNEKLGKIKPNEKDKEIRLNDTYEKNRKIINETQKEISTKNDDHHKLKMDLIRMGFYDKSKEELKKLKDIFYFKNNEKSTLSYFKSKYLQDLKDMIINGLKSEKNIIILRTTVMDISNITIDDKNNTRDGDTGLHAVCVIINKQLKTVEYFEPHGQFSAAYDSQQIISSVNRLMNEIFETNNKFKFGSILDSELYIELLKESNSNSSSNLYGGNSTNKLDENDLAELNNKMLAMSAQYQHNTKKLTILQNRLRSDKKLKYFLNIQVINDDFYFFIKELHTLGKNNLELIKNQYMKGEKITVDTKYINNITKMIDHIYVLNVGSYKQINYKSTLTFGGLGPQALSHDAYCLAWSIFASILQILNPDKSVIEIETMLKSKKKNLSTSQCKEILKYKNTDLGMYLELMYTPIAPNLVLDRIELFILWMGQIMKVISIVNIKNGLDLSKLFTSENTSELNPNKILLMI